MPEPLTPDDFVECTTESKRLKHYSLCNQMRGDERSSRYGMKPIPGLTGYSLCGGYGTRDQIRLDYDLNMWHGKPVTIADLPLCEQCEKSRQRRIDGRPS